jgi:hypothetical protein
LIRLSDGFRKWPDRAVDKEVSMKANVVGITALCLAGAVAAPGAAAAQTAVQLELRAAADTTKAQQLAQVAPEKADAYLRRSRTELATAYRKARAEGETRAAALTQRLRTDAEAMRALARNSSGRLAAHAAGAVQPDIQMEAHFALHAPPEQQSAAADAAGDMTNTALRGLHETPARVHAVRQAFARAVAQGLELGRALARRIAAQGATSADNAQGEQSDLLARIESWVSSLNSELNGSADGSASVDSQTSGSVTLSALAGDVAGELQIESSTFSAGVRGQVAPGWAGVLP